MNKLGIALWIVVICLAAVSVGRSQCQEIGQVVDSPTCGLTVFSLSTAVTYLPEGISGLEADQWVSFTVDTISGTPCEALPRVTFSCFEWLGSTGACIDTSSIDLTHPCGNEYDPVCGCDGITYQNACQAEHWYGVSVWYPGACPNETTDCEAAFLYTYLEGNTVTFYNSSAGFIDASWDFGDGATILGEDMFGAIVTFAEDTATVCLTVTNDAGCADEYCLFIHSGSDEEMCEQTDCVWPGDTDGDSKANHYDLLNIGVGYGVQGPGREFFPFPDDPIAWAPHYSDEWGNSVGSVNYKHLDCNGDGQIDADDVEAIPHNYSPDFEFSPQPTPGAPLIYLEIETPTIVIDDDSPDFLTVNANLMVGSNLIPALDLYGMALQVDYPFDLVVPNTVTADYDDNSFFGHIHDILTVREDLYNYNLGRYDLAFSRKDGENSNGYGKVASLQFIVNADIIDGRSFPDTTFNFTLSGVKFIDSDGNPLAFDFPTDTASVTIINDIVAGTAGAPVDRNGQWRVFPNPTGDWLRVEVATELTGSELELYDATGRRLARRKLIGPRLELDLTQHAPGVYWLRVRTAMGVLARKVLVKR